MQVPAQVQPYMPQLVGLVVALLVLAMTAHAAWSRFLPHRATGLLSATLGGKAHLVWCWHRRNQWSIAWRLPAGSSSAKVQANRQAFEEHLDAGVAFEFDRGLLRGTFGTAKLPRRVDWSEFMRHQPKSVGSMLLPIPLGASRTGKRWADLTTGHLLVGGTTNFGKSVWLRQCLASLVQRYRADRLRLVLVDLKSAVEFRVFSNLPHLMGPVVSDVAGCIDQVAAVNAEIDVRLAILEQYRVENIARMNARRKDDPMPYMVVVVDELAELRPGDTSDKEAKGERQRAISLLMRIGRLGRAAGVHLIACTQRADADTVPGQLKAQLGSTIAFFTRDDVASRILLDSPAASDLPPLAGRALYQHGGELSTVQVPYVELAEVEEIVSRLCMEHAWEAMREEGVAGG